jgi:hypothetical protein
MAWMLAPLAILVEQPWIAVVVALTLYLLTRTRTLRVPLIAAAGWLAYSLYEYGMKLRILCSGECNIRVDLLLVYPLLIVLTLAAIISLLRNARG